MKRLAALALMLAVAAVGVTLTAATGASDAGSPTHKYKILFDNAFGLTKGGDLRVGGVRAGVTSGFDVERSKDGRALAVVDAKLNQPGFGELRSDASCEIKPQSLIGEYFVDCQPGSSNKKLKDGGTIGLNHTSSTIALDSVQDILRRPYRERLTILLNELGTGLAGRSQDLRSVLMRADPGLRETDKTLKILAAQNQRLQSFFVNADTVIAPLERKKAELVRWIRETRHTAQITATRRAALQETIRRLPGFLDQLTPTMRQLGVLADRQRPLLTDLRAGAAPLNTFLTRLRPFANATTPALRALGTASVTGVKAIKDSREEIAELRRVAALGPATGTAPDQQGTIKPLRQFLQALDDRKRAGDETSTAERRAAASDPPAPDPTHIAAGTAQGFTGLEAVWNYPFWQSLAINGYDSVGHVLRVSGIISKCASWQTGPITDANRQIFADCNQFLGPNQPGVTTPDPTRTGASTSPAARALLRDNDKPAAVRSEKRSEGQPALGPVAGQPDRSHPDQQVPSGADTLLDKLLKGSAQRATQTASDAATGTNGQAAANPQDASDLLDYLLGN